MHINTHEVNMIFILELHLVQTDTGQVIDQLFHILPVFFTKIDNFYFWVTDVVMGHSLKSTRCRCLRQKKAQCDKWPLEVSQKMNG